MESVTLPPLLPSPQKLQCDAIVLVERLQMTPTKQLTESPPVSAVNVTTLPTPYKPEKDEVTSVVYLTVKSKLGILENKRIVKEACSAECTWLEFFQTFQAYITQPDNYYILGRGGRTAQLDRPVSEYVDAFEKPLQVYAVSLEPKSRPMVVSAKRIRVKPSKLQYSVQVAPNKKRKLGPPIKPGPLCSRFGTGIRGGQTRLPPVVLVKSSEITPEEAKAACSQFAATASSTVMNQISSAHTYRNYSENLQRQNLEVYNGHNKLAIESVSSTPQKITPVASSNGKIVRKSAVYSPASSGSSASNGGVSVGLAEIVSDTEFAPVDTFSNVKLNNSTDFTTVATSNSQVERKPEIFKSYAIDFLQRKVSNEDMKVVHQEIMNLKHNGDYFQLTRKAPLAAGLLEQLLCPPVMYLDRQNSDEKGNFH